MVRPERRATLAEVSAHAWLEKWRPHALRTPPRRYGLTHHELDPDLLAKIEEKFGLKAAHVTASLQGGLYNHATATYSLLEEGRGVTK